MTAALSKNTGICVAGNAKSAASVTADTCHNANARPPQTRTALSRSPSRSREATSHPRKKSFLGQDGDRDGGARHEGKIPDCLAPVGRAEVGSAHDPGGHADGRQYDDGESARKHIVLQASPGDSHRLARILPDPPSEQCERKERQGAESTQAIGVHGRRDSNGREHHESGARQAESKHRVSVRRGFRSSSIRRSRRSGSRRRRRPGSGRRVRRLPLRLRAARSTARCR